MYVCVVVDKLNHCTAFKPRRSPGHKYTHADIQVRERGGLVTNRDSLGVPGEEELRFQETVRGQRGRSGAPRLRGPTAQGPRLLEVQGVYKNKTKQNLSNTRSRKWGPEPGAEAPSVCSQEKEPNVDLKSRIVSVWRDKLLPCLNVEVKRVDPHREKSSWDPKKKKKRFLQSNRVQMSQKPEDGSDGSACLSQSSNFTSQHKPAQTETFCWHVVSIRPSTLWLTSIVCLKCCFVHKLKITEIKSEFVKEVRSSVSKLFWRLD